MSDTPPPESPDEESYSTAAGASFLGSLALCTLMPGLALWWHCSGILWRGGVKWNLLALATLFLCAGFALSPVMLFLEAHIFWKLQGTLGDAKSHMYLEHGIARGILLNSLNVPGYALIFFLPDRDEMALVRFVCLMILTGAACGAWIGWQAYRERHPEAPRWPAFSLRTLVLAVLALGVLMALFRPRG